MVKILEFRAGVALPTRRDGLANRRLRCSAQRDKKLVSARGCHLCCPSSLMEKPDTITVAVAHREEIKADKVDIHVTVKGSSLFTGNAALKKAKEVSQLISALGEVGVKELAVQLQSVHAESSSGILGRSTSATYQIRVRCSELEALADILGVVTVQKNAKLDFLSWRYPDEKQARIQWLRACVAEANEKAAEVASVLGVKLLGVHSLSEKWTDSEQSERAYLSEVTASGVKFVKALAKTVDLGFPLSHSKGVELQTEAQFRVSGFDPARTV